MALRVASMAPRPAHLAASHLAPLVLMADSELTYTVGELTAAINRQLRAGFGSGVWVTGEISGRRDSGPHTYFSLVEDIDGSKATVSVSLFANVKRSLTPMLAANRLELTDGTRVRVFGTLDVYAPTGRLSLKISNIDPQFTLGDITAARDAVMARLAAEKLLDANSRIAMPTVPLRVGVVTSIGSAAWHDFADEITRSGHGFHLVAVDARVQGDQAESMVASGIATAVAHGVDVVVVIRGGGARNELAAFDTEGIARAIATCPVPVLTGLGHEIDRTVADEVAHTALKTPTACADWLVDRVSGFVDGLEARAQKVAARTHAALARSAERLRSRTDRLSRIRLVLDRASNGLDDRAHRLDLLDPVRLLERGWSITLTADGRVVRSIADVSASDTVVTRVADGRITSTVVSSDSDGM
jgi:exodeoxyribonuclease VII large subunit